VTDDAETITGDNDDRAGQSLHEVKDGGACREGAVQATGTLDDDKVAAISPHLQAIRQQLIIDFTSFDPSSCIRSQRCEETLRADFFDPGRQ
jgi:hypothetical protein